MTMRDDLDFLTIRNERRMNRWRRDLRDETLAAIAKQVAYRGRFDVLAYVLVSRDLDRIYDTAYARWRGDDSAPLGRHIREQTRYARWLAFWRQWQDIMRRVPADVARAIREAA